VKTAAPRTWLKRLLLGGAALVVAYLLPANLFLNTPLGSWALNRRPQMLKVTWNRAWSLYPGDVTVRGLKLRGATPTVRWSVDLDRARGWIDLTALLGRQFRISGLVAEGGRSVTLRVPAPPRKGPPRKKAGGRGWTIRIEGASVSRVQALGYQRFLLEGEGRMTGGFSLVTRGGPFQLHRTTLRMPKGRLSLDGAPFARGVDTDAEIRIDSYRRREHPGIQGWNFVSGSLQATGQVPDLPILEALGDPGRGGAGGPMKVDLRMERGLFSPGSRLAFRAPRQGDLEPLTIDASISAPGGPGLVVRAASRGLTIGRRKEGPPLLRTGAARIVAVTPELRASRLFGVVRQLKPGSRLGPGVLDGDLVVEDLDLYVTGGRVSWRMEIDRGTGRLDLPALLRRELLLDGVRAEGITGQAELTVPVPGTGRPPWLVALSDARFTAVRELGFENFRLSGDGQVEVNVTSAGGKLSVEQAGAALKAGRLRMGEETVADGLSLKTEVRMVPFVPGAVSEAGFLRGVSGGVRLQGRIASLGFLERYLERVSWLRVRGQGTLDADVRLQEGHLLPGTRLAVRASRLKASVLDVLATGSASLRGTVRDQDAELAVAFDRFAVAPNGGKRPSSYLRGRGLRVTVLSKDLDLATPVSDLRARVDLADGEVPDLSVYNDFLPAGAGVAILSGAGRVRLGLSLDAAKQTGQGTATLSSDAAAFRFQDLTVAGRLGVRGVISTSDLESRRFQLAGTNLTLDGVTYESAGEETREEKNDQDWWARAELTDGSMLWKKPLVLDGTARMKMKNADPILALFAQKKRYLGWFQDLVTIEDITAAGKLRLDNDVLEVSPLQVLGNRFDLRSRLRFSRAGAQGDLYVRYRRLSVGVQLDKGKRDFKLRRPLSWYEGRSGGP
jgi:hypothetical protein